jgi:hypothetical protein
MQPEIELRVIRVNGEVVVRVQLVSETVTYTLWDTAHENALCIRAKAR